MKAYTCLVGLKKVLHFFLANISIRKAERKTQNFTIKHKPMLVDKTAT